MMAIQDEIKKDTETFLESKIEFYISLFFYNLKVSNKIANFELKIKEDSSLRFQNVCANKNFLAVENFDYTFLLKRLEPRRIVELVNAVLLERPIFIIDDDLSEMAIIMRSILSLIKPLTWVAPLVPIVPKRGVELLAAPMGGLFGIHQDVWEEW